MLVNLIYFTDANERKTLAQQDTGIGKRFISQTAPAYDNSNHPQYRGAGGGGRVPNTKTSGTVTRRTDGLPTRRGNNNNNNQDDPLSRLPSSAPAIAVTGLGGLRVIKASGTQKPGKGGRTANKKILL